MSTDIDYAAASAIQRAKVANQIDFAVASKAMDAVKQQGQSAVELIDQAAELQDQLASGRIDVRI